MTTTDQHARLDAAVDANFARQTEWLATLVKFPSVRGEEAPCQDWIAREFSARGWPVDRYTLADVEMSHLPGFSPVMDTDYSRAVQVVASLRPSAQKGRSLILQGHVDVVPTGPELGRAAVRSGHPERQDDRPRRQRHEVRCVGDGVRTRCAAQS